MRSASCARQFRVPAISSQRLVADGFAGVLQVADTGDLGTMTDFDPADLLALPARAPEPPASCGTERIGRKVVPAA